MTASEQTPIPSHCVTRSTLKVRFAETDLMGVVHHANYLVYFEAGRIDYLRRRGLEYRALVDEQVHLPVVKTTVLYRRPARFNDDLVIETRLAELGRASLSFAVCVLREDDGAEVIVAEGSTELACVGADRAPRRLPPDARRRLLEAEAPRR